MIDRYGPAAGPLAILLHGAVVNRKAMQPLAEALAPVMRVAAPDLPGHGALRDRAFGLAAAVDEIRALVAAHAGEQIVVAGDSLGGYVALAVAAAMPGALGAIVAGGCTFPMHGVFALAAAVTDVPAAMLARMLGEARTERALLAAFRALGGDAATSGRIAEAGMRLAARGESIRALRDVRLRVLIEAIGVPVVFVNGARDVPIAWCAQTYARRARHGSAVAISGAPHGVMTLRPNAVAEIILAQVQADGANSGQSSAPALLHHRK